MQLSRPIDLHPAKYISPILYRSLNLHLSAVSTKPPRYFHPPSISDLAFTGESQKDLRSKPRGKRLLIEYLSVGVNAACRRKRRCAKLPARLNLAVPEYGVSPPDS